MRRSNEIPFFLPSIRTVWAVVSPDSASSVYDTLHFVDDFLDRRLLVTAVSSTCLSIGSVGSIQDYDSDQSSTMATYEEDA